MNIEYELERVSVKGILNKQSTKWVRLDVAIRKCKNAINSSSNSEEKKE